ncbi:MAG: hypothetical protein WAV00_18035 [Nocardioides sp.]
MVLAVTLLVLSVMVIPLLVLGMMRRFGMEEAETERALLAPDAHTVAWVVPEGEDPATVRTHLSHAGFTSVLDRSGDQRLVVECEPGDREMVRDIIAHAAHSTFDGQALQPSQLRFDDDPA